MNQKQSLLVSCKGINYSSGKLDILSNINLDINKKEIITIVGPNGGGKSTLAKIIIGVLSPTTGKLYRVKKLRIGYMPQKISVDKMLPITAHKFLLLNLQKKLLKDIDIDKFTSQHGISKILDRQIRDISGGEMQKLMLARLMLRNPDILVLDEPTQGLDVKGQKDFYSFLEHIKEEQNKSIVMISHDLHTVMKASDKVVCLNKVICCSGIPGDITQNAHYRGMFAFGDAPAVVSYYKHKHK